MPLSVWHVVCFNHDNGRNCFRAAPTRRGCKYLRLHETGLATWLGSAQKPAKNSTNRKKPSRPSPEVAGAQTKAPKVIVNGMTVRLPPVYRVALAYPKFDIKCGECDSVFPASCSYKSVSAHYRKHDMEVEWTCRDCVGGSAFANSSVYVLSGHRRRCLGGAAREVLCELCGTMCSGETGYGLHLRQAHIEQYESRMVKPKRAAWSELERKVLALAELAYRKNFPQNNFRQMSSALVETHPFRRSLGAINAQRRTPAYVAVLARCARESPEGELPLGANQDLGHGSTDSGMRASLNDAVDLDDLASDTDESITDESEVGETLPVGALAVGGSPGCWVLARTPNCVKSRLCAFLLRRLYVELLERRPACGKLNAFLQFLRARGKVEPRLWRTLPSVKDPRRGTGGAVQYNSEKARRFHQVQAWWKKNRRMCLRAILDGTPVDELPPRRELVEPYYRGQFERESYHGGPWKIDVAVPCVGAMMVPPFDSEEVRLSLKRVHSGTSPGLLCGLPAGFLKRVPLQFLVALFNVWFGCGRVPASLKRSYTKLIPKRAHGLGEVKNWRPVTVGPLLLRVYCSIIARRLQTACTLSLEQKAFLPADGCSENVVLLDSLFRCARIRGRSLLIVFLDLSQAFSTVSHHSIELAMRRHGVPGKIIGSSGICTPAQQHV